MDLRGFDGITNYELRDTNYLSRKDMEWIDETRYEFQDSRCEVQG